MIFNLYSIAGWIGMFLVIIAYFLLATKKLKSSSLLYNLLNLFGGIGLIASTFATKSWPAMTLNVVWGGIAIFSIYKITKIKPVYKEIK
jgi:paired small multidrug resistance pump